MATTKLTWKKDGDQWVANRSKGVQVRITNWNAGTTESQYIVRIGGRTLGSARTLKEAKEIAIWRD